MTHPGASECVVCEVQGVCVSSLVGECGRTGMTLGKWAVETPGAGLRRVLPKGQ